MNMTLMPSGELSSKQRWPHGESVNGKIRTIFYFCRDVVRIGKNKRKRSDASTVFYPFRRSDASAVFYLFRRYDASVMERYVLRACETKQ